MIKILFVCHGNICRSTMAEFWQNAEAMATGSISSPLLPAERRSAIRSITGPGGYWTVWGSTAPESGPGR